MIMKKQDCVGIDARKTNKKALIQTQNQPSFGLRN